MADDLASVTFAVETGFAALAHSPAPLPTLVPTMADTFLPLPDQQRIVALQGPMPFSTPFLIGGSTVSGPYKVAWAFTGPTGLFWTELYHTASGGPYQAVQAAYTAANARAAFLSPQCGIVYIQASDVSQPKASYRQYQTVNGAAPGSGAVSNLGDADAVILCKIFNSNNQYVNKFFRGCPANWFQRTVSGGEITPANFSLIQDFVKQIVPLGYGWQPVNPVTKVVGGPYNYQNIQSINGTALPGYATLTFASAPTFSGPPMMYFTGTDQKLLPGLLGVFNVVAVVGNLVTIQYQVANNATITNPKGKARVYLLQPVTAFVNSPPPTFNGFSNRHTKSDFGRGRRASRARGIRTLV